MNSRIDAEQVDEILSQRSLRKSRRLWRYIAFAALAVAVIAIFGRMLGTNTSQTSHIARIVIDGAINSDPERREIIDNLIADEAVGAVIIQINSPGGSAAGGEELYEGISRIRAVKPAVAIINEVGASAAYMTAIAADRIFARRTSMTGSIGVLFMHLNASGLFEMLGLDLDKVATGPLKSEPDPDEAMSFQTRKSLQQLVDSSYDWFVDSVAERRDLPRPRVLALADGRVMTGLQALDEKLIDQIGGEYEALDWLADTHDINDLEIQTYYPDPETDWKWVNDLVFQSARQWISQSIEGATALDGLVSVWQPAR